MQTKSKTQMVHVNAKFLSKFMALEIDFEQKQGAKQLSVFVWLEIFCWIIAG